MTRIIHVISDTNIGGAGRYLLAYLSEYDREKYDVKVVLPKDSKLIERMEKLDVSTIVINAMKDKSFDIRGAFKLEKIFRKEQPDIVHAHAAVSARIAARIAGVKSITYTRHSVFEPKGHLKKGPIHAVNMFLDRNCATKIIAVANAAKQNLVDVGIDEKKITVVYNGVEALPVYSDDEKAKVREGLGVPDGVPIVAMAARITAVKGQDYVIRAAKILRDKGVDARFIIAGTGDKAVEYKQLASDLGLEDYVLFTGFLKDVAGLVNAAALQVNASWGTEAASLQLMEGMSLGKPSVVTDYGGNPELITDGLNGFIVPQKDAEALAEAIGRILGSKREEERLAKFAKVTYENRFTAKVMVRNMEKFYGELIGDKE